jgi:FdhE protein
VDAHPYLRPVAELCARIERAAAGVDVQPSRLPDWDAYRPDFEKGIPLLRSPRAAVDLEPAGKMTRELAERVGADPADEDMAEEASDLADALRGRPGADRLVADWLLGDAELDTSAPGLLRYLGWTAMSRYLAPLVRAFGEWRDEEKWHRKECPTCGSAPAMGQLVGVDPGRQRFLCCGRCGTRWRYRRTLCPFCENDAQRISVLAIEGEGRLRIDHCGACKGYPQDLRRAGPRSPPARGLDVAPSRHAGSRPRPETTGRLALRASG